MEWQSKVKWCKGIVQLGQALYGNGKVSCRLVQPRRSDVQLGHVELRFCVAKVR